jgi:hypothetical protein
MTYLTIFTAPKPFTNPHINIIQRNAIRSWLYLGDEVEVMVFGDEPGIAEAAIELGAHHIPSVARNDKGTPLLNDIFAKAHDLSQSPVLAYANADILFVADFLKAAKVIQGKSKAYLTVGRRWNLDVHEELDFSPLWEDDLRARIQKEGELFIPTGIDYFIFPRHLFVDLPPFSVGRSGWDNWMIYEGYTRGYDLIDATHGITAVHQNHDYHHLPGNKPHYGTEEAKVNIALAGGPRKIYNILDTKLEYVNGRIKPARFSRIRFVRALERRFQTNQGSGLRWFIASRLKRLQRRWNFQ